MTAEIRAGAERSEQAGMEELGDVKRGEATERSGQEKKKRLGSLGGARDSTGGSRSRALRGCRPTPRPPEVTVEGGMGCAPTTNIAFMPAAPFNRLTKTLVQVSVASFKGFDYFAFTGAEQEFAP